MELYYGFNFITPVLIVGFYKRKGKRKSLIFFSQWTSNRIDDRYALVVVGHEDQGSQGYSAF